MPTHVVQSADWADFKNKYGTPTTKVGDVFYTKHPIPFTEKFIAYCPKVEPTKIDFSTLSKSLIENNCISINFDVPNVINGTEQDGTSQKIFEQNKCVKTSRTQFAPSNILLDLTPDQDQLFANLHYKHRYNTKYAQKNEVIVRQAKTQEDFDKFYELVETTAVRQKYYARSRRYLQTLWDTLSPKGIAHILISEYKNTPLAAWMLFTYDDVLYYPYGGSSESYKNLNGSTILGWEAILFGKNHGCKTFDMWGASDNLSNTRDPWWGFTNFKMRFGGAYVKYMDSYDFVVKHTMYKAFLFANDIRWKVLNAIR